MPVRRFVALDSLRGVAACMVVLLHSRGNGLITGSPWVFQGWLAVDFFFVLSGFVIAANYAARLEGGFGLGAYLWLRIGRVWPLHLAVIAASVLMEAIGPLFGAEAFTGRQAFTGNHSPANLFLSTFLLQIWQGPEVNGWNTQSWSISGEVFLYALFGLAWSKSGRAALALAAVLAAAMAAIRVLDVDVNDYLTRALLGFPLGVLVWSVHRRLAHLELGRRGASALEAAGAAAILFALYVYPVVDVVGFDLLFAFAILVFARDAGILSQLLARPFPVLLGTISYSIYMIHLLIIRRLFNLLTVYGGWSGRQLVGDYDGGLHPIAGFPLADLISLAGLAIVIFAATLTYRWIEAPARDVSRRMLGLAPRREPAPPRI